MSLKALTILVAASNLLFHLSSPKYDDAAPMAASNFAPSDKSRPPPLRFLKYTRFERVLFFFEIKRFLFNFVWFDLRRLERIFNLFTLPLVI